MVYDNRYAIYYAKYYVKPFIADHHAKPFMPTKHYCHSRTQLSRMAPKPPTLHPSGNFRINSNPYANTRGNAHAFLGMGYSMD